MMRTVSQEVFRSRVRQVLERSGLSFAGFARQAGLDRSTLSQLLTGPMPRLPRAETLAMIAQCAHVSVDWLLGLSQREEMGAEIIEAVMKVEPYENSPAQDSFIGWLKAAHGLRICTVPAAFPDLLKTETVLRLQYSDAFDSGGMTPADAVARRLDMHRQPHQHLEMAVSRTIFVQFALGTGLWGSLSAAQRREQIAHAIRVCEALYPAMRLYLYDGDRSFSAPFSVFGGQRVALFLGTSYLVLNAPAHIGLFLSRFDALVRAAVVQPDEISAFLTECLEMVS